MDFVIRLRRARFLFIFCGILALAAPGFSQPASISSNPKTPAQAATLRVAAREIAPFVMRKNGKLSGFSIDLWNAIAAQMGVASKFEMKPGVTALVESVRTGQADVGVGATSITSQRDRIADFSQPISRSRFTIRVCRFWCAAKIPRLRFSTDCSKCLNRR